MRTFQESVELRQKIYSLMLSGQMAPKQISQELKLPIHIIYYHLKRGVIEPLEMTYLRADLADALTRERFYKNLIERISRRLLYLTEFRKPAPIIRREP